MPSTSITVRTDEALRRELEKRASSAGKSLSQLVREILETAVADRPMAERTGDLRGRLELARREDELWRARLRERNWRSIEENLRRRRLERVLDHAGKIEIDLDPERLRRSRERG